MAIYFKDLRSQITLTSSIAVLVGSLISHSVSAQSASPNVIEPPADLDHPVTDAGTHSSGAEDNRLVEDVIIMGTRSNLMSAQAIKRDADTMVDAVSAVDIRVLENRSVLDAIQRLPGISLERFADPSDPDRFSVEASNVIIRGMAQSRSEFNGRDSFTANSGRGLSYQDIPPELMGSIEIFKNQTADMIEGGIGGTVTLRTRKPFDSDERVMSFSSDVSWGDIARELSPSFSGLYSDRINTDVGEFGVLVNYAKSAMYGESHGIQSDTFLPYYPLAEHLDARLGLITENNPGAEGTRAQDFLGEDGPGVVWLPSAANLLMKEDTRKREGLAAAFQYRNPDETILATFEYIRSDSNLTWNERSIKYQGGYHTPTTRMTQPLEGTHLIFDENGLFEAGTLTNGRDNFRVGQSGTNRVPTNRAPGPPLWADFKQWGHNMQMDSRVNDTSTLVEDASLNIQWSPTDRLALSADYQRVRADTVRDDVSVHINTWAHIAYDIRGSVPRVTYIEPWNGARDAARAEEGEGNSWDAITDGEPDWPGFGGDPMGDQNYFQDDNSYFWRSAMDHYERSEGELTALKLDASYEFDHDFVRSIKTGFRHSDRQQVVRATDWNWGALAPEWQGGNLNWDLEEGEYMGQGIGWLSDVEFQRDGYEHVNWSNFMGGGVATIQGNQTIHATEDLIRSVMGRDPSRVLAQSPVDNNWVPYPTRDGLDAQYGMFRPDEINTTAELTNAVYLRLDFGGDTELPYSGNIGLRYVKMQRTALGAVAFPMLKPANRNTVRAVPDELTLPLDPITVDTYLHQQVTDGHFPDFASAANSLANNWAKNPYNYLPDNERSFSTAVPVADNEFDPAQDVLGVEVDQDLILPSFNIKVDLTSSLVGRFAIAKAAAFPDMGDVRNRIEFERIEFKDIEVEDRTVTTDEGRNVFLIESAKLARSGNEQLWVGQGGNPYIKPMTSTQYDFSLEWYFSDAGQLSATIFHKNLDNYFTQGVITREFTHPITGSTQETAVTSTRNGGKAKLDGLELTYHQYFDGLFEGFGVQATYTYIDAHSMPNNEKDVSNEQWFDSIYEDTGIRVNFDRLPLEGQSEHTVNLVGVFETSQWSARLAYNWRSKYLLTTRDVISKAPLWYEDHGELDGSLLYHISDIFTVGLQATNMTNARSDTTMILNDDLLSTGRSWFVSDRRLALVFRGEF